MYILIAAVAVGYAVYKHFTVSDILKDVTEAHDVLSRVAEKVEDSLKADVSTALGKLKSWI